MPPRSKKVKNENSALKVAEFGNDMKEGIVSEKGKIDENTNDEVDQEAKEKVEQFANENSSTRKDKTEKKL